MRALILILLLAGCAAPRATETPPTCLNVQEGDRHVEFDGRNLRLSETGTPRVLQIENGEGVRCERLEILRNAHHPSVLIEYTTKGVRKSGIASIKDASWIQAPK